MPSPPMDEPLIPLFSDRQTTRLSFTGDGAEYFRIWIVNLALTIVTLGVYSPWAKVRRMQYFARHTRLADASFDYHGDPIAILKGRLVALVLVVAYTVSGAFGPFVTLGVFGAILAIMPWLITRSLQFRLRNTSYRGLRFGFAGRARTAYGVFLGFGLLTLATIGLAAPLWYQRIKRFQFSNARFGRSVFSMSASVADVYRAFIGVALAGVLGGFLLVTAVYLVSGVGAALGLAPEDGAEPPVVAVVAVMFLSAVLFLLYILILFGLQSLLTVRLRNVVWNHTALGEHRFASSLEVGTLLWVDLTNLALTVMSLGLFRPFAEGRRARAIIDATSIESPGALSLDEFEAVEGETPGALGDEAAGMFDLDIAF